jgi:hypothetical protein
MRRYKKAFVVISICLLTIQAAAQYKQSPIPLWASQLGYWVLENNIHNERHYVVRFYNNDNLLVYTETLDGVKLNPTKKRVKMKLKKALELCITAWEKSRQPMANKAYVKNLVK